MITLVSGSEGKIREIVAFLEAADIAVRAARISLVELQTADLDAIVEDKCLKAFAAVGRPLIVDHTGLYLAALNGFPGGLCSVFWDAMGPERIADLFGAGHDADAHARTVIGYCDGRRVRTFDATLRGTISPRPSGPGSFGWDCLFVPEGHTATLAELRGRKAEVSMRSVALGKFVAHLREGEGA